MDSLTYLTLLMQHGYVDDGQIQMTLEEQKITGKEIRVRLARWWSMETTNARTAARLTL